MNAGLSGELVVYGPKDDPARQKLVERLESAGWGVMPAESPGKLFVEGPNGEVFDSIEEIEATFFPE